jgi:hypothetical protein
VLLQEDRAAPKHAAGAVIFGQFALALSMEMPNRCLLCISNPVPGPPHAKTEVGILLIEEVIRVEAVE